MTAASLASPDHPLALAYWRFNVGVAELVHPTRRPAPQPLDWAGQVLRRHWSSRLLREMRLPVVKAFDDPRLPLAMADPPLFDRLLVCAGACLLGPAIRRLILRSEVAVVEAQLGPEVMQLLRRDAFRLWPGTDDQSRSAVPPDAAAAARRLGAAVLAMAFEGAPEAIACRARLRLPAQADLADTALPPPLSTPAAALQLSRSILQALDPQWLSLFPAPR